MRRFVALITIALVAVGLWFAFHKTPPNGQSDTDPTQANEPAVSGSDLPNFDESRSGSGTSASRDSATSSSSTLAAASADEAPLSIAPEAVVWPVKPLAEVVKRGPLDPTRVRGEMVAARVTSGGKTYEQLPNYEGQFPSVYVGPSTLSEVSLFFPESQPGDRVLAQMEDGGKIDTDKYVKDGLLDENRLLNFTFTTAENNGTYKVTIRKDSDIKTLEFWVGPDIPIRQTANSK